VIGIENILTFKSQVVRMMLTPETLWCARHPENLAKPALSAKRCNSPIACLKRSAAPTPLEHRGLQGLKPFIPKDRISHYLCGR
jgi:hypothetical protein